MELPLELSRPGAENGFVGKEARRSARVATKLLVGVEGVDAEPKPRAGDISSTGIYFECDVDIGEVGTVQWLHLRSHDGACEIHLMAHVVRSVSMKELDRPRLGGVALEFMPENDERIAALQEFVRYVLQGDPAEGAFIAPRVDTRAGAADGPTRGATLQKLSVSTLSLEARWSVPVGETVRVEIVAPGVAKPIRLQGRAVHVAPEGKGGRFHIELEFQEELDGPLRRLSSKSFAAVRPTSAGELLAAVPESERTPSSQPALSSRGGAPASSPEPPPVSSPLDGTDDEYISRTLEELLSALIVPPPEDSPSPRRAHLAGLLSRVRLPTLAALFEMDRISGELTLVQGEERATIFVRDGRIVDVESAALDPRPRPQLARLFGWMDGSFEFIVRPVTRADRVELSTTALLLDLAREADEAARTRASEPAGPPPPETSDAI